MNVTSPLWCLKIRSLFLIHSFSGRIFCKRMIFCTTYLSSIFWRKTFVYFLMNYAHNLIIIFEEKETIGVSPILGAICFPSLKLLKGPSDLKWGDGKIIEGSRKKLLGLFKSVSCFCGFVPLWNTGFVVWLMMNQVTSCWRFGCLLPLGSAPIDFALAGLRQPRVLLWFLRCLCQNSDLFWRLRLTWCTESPFDHLPRFVCFFGDSGVIWVLSFMLLFLL